MPRPRHTDLAAIRAKQLRRDLTISEARLWSFIKNRRTGARFRRQVPIGPWIVDFASFDPRLVIEVDGPSHDHSDEATRTEFLRDMGFEILRFDNKEIAQELDNIVDAIRWSVRHLQSQGE